MHCIRQFPQNDIPVFSSNTQYYAHFFINLDFVLQIELRDINLVGGGYNFGVLTAPANRGVDCRLPSNLWECILSFCCATRFWSVSSLVSP